MAESQEDLLAQLLKETREQNKLIKDAASDTGWDTAISIATKILAFTVDQAKVLDSIGLKNSTLNVSFGKLKDEIHKQGFRFGTMAEHMQMQLNLHKIGYKTINKELRDGLVWLDKADGQGQDLLKFMESMSESGTTHKTQEIIANKIIEMANHTGQSARAAIAALDHIGDQQAILRVLGVQEGVSQAILKVSEDFPQVTSSKLGQFIKEVLDPKNMAQQMHQGIYGPLTKTLMSNATSDTQKYDAIIQMLKNANAASERAVLQGRGDTFITKQFRETLLGVTGNLSLEIEGQRKNMKGLDDNLTTDKMKESSAKSYYDGSLTHMTDVAANTAQLTPIHTMMRSLTKFILGDKFVDPSMGTAAQRGSIDISKFDDDTPWRVGQKSVLNYLPDWMGGIGTDAWDYHSALDRFKRETQPLTRDNPDAYDQKYALQQMKLRSEGKPYEMFRDGGWASNKDHKRDPWEDPFPSVGRKPRSSRSGKFSSMGFPEDFSNNPFMNANGDPITVQLPQKQVNQIAPTPSPVPVVLPTVVT